jgi:cytochrome c553
LRVARHANNRAPERWLAPLLTRLIRPTTPVITNGYFQTPGRLGSFMMVVLAPPSVQGRPGRGGEMKKLFVAVTVLAFGAVAGVATAVRAEDVPPPWAYGFPTPPPPGAGPAAPNPAQVLDNTTPLTLAGSTLSFTRAQVANRYGPADWFPQDHPTMPEIVAKGRETAEPKIYACSLCHYPNGKGRPENANITGLTYEYFVQQLMDFRNGARKTSDPRKANTGTMAGFAKSMTDEEIKAAATYFTSIPATPWIKVVEAALVPKTRGAGGMFLTLEGAEAGTEPIGTRIIETPENAHETEFLRNSRSGFIAYMPPGSLKKGEALVMNGVTASGGKVTACTVCHGPDLRGLGPVPTLAGRSPSYLARQLYDMQHGNRNGTWTPLMAPVLANLGSEDLLTAAAYLSSLRP